MDPSFSSKDRFRVGLRFGRLGFWFFDRIRFIRDADCGSGIAVMLEGFGFFNANSLASWSSEGRISNGANGRLFRVKLLEPVMEAWCVSLKVVGEFLVKLLVVCFRVGLFGDFFVVPRK